MTKPTETTPTFNTNFKQPVLQMTKYEKRLNALQKKRKLKQISGLKKKLKKSKKRRDPNSTSKLKDDLWKLFSQYIRQRAADWRGNATCVTCGKTAHWKKMQAGHFIPGRHNAILFEPRGVHVQCYKCNCPLKGNPRKYDRFMRENYGQEVIDELERLDATTKQFTPQELKDLIVQYKDLISKL